MTPKEKALDLWLCFYERLPDGIYSNEAAKIEAKGYAIICVNKLLEESSAAVYHPDRGCDDESYWQQVKTEIENL